MENVETTETTVVTPEKKPFKLTNRKKIIAGIIFMFGFYVSTSLIGDIFLHINGFDYSYQINTNKTFKILILCSVLSVILTLFYTLSFLVSNMVDKSGIRMLKRVVIVYIILLAISQILFFNSNHKDEVDKGYRELTKYIQSSSHQDFSKSDLQTQILADKEAGNETKLISYIKDRANLISIPNTVLTRLISIGEVTKQPETKAKFNEIYKDQFITRSELNEYKQLIDSIERSKYLSESLVEMVATLKIRAETKQLTNIK